MLRVLGVLVVLSLAPSIVLAGGEETFALKKLEYLQLSANSLWSLSDDEGACFVFATLALPDTIYIHAVYDGKIADVKKVVSRVISMKNHLNLLRERHSFEWMVTKENYKDTSRDTEDN